GVVGRDRHGDPGRVDRRGCRGVVGNGESAVLYESPRRGHHCRRAGPSWAMSCTQEAHERCPSLMAPGIIRSLLMACGDRARREKWLSIALSFNGHLSRVCGYRGFCRDFEDLSLAGEHDIQRGVDRLRDGVQLVVGPV